MLLSILKIVAIVLLCLIGLALIAAAMILLVPVRYSFDGQYHGEFNVHASVTWLLKAVNCSLEYENGEFTTDIRLLGRKIGNNRPVQDTEESDDRQKEPETTDVDGTYTEASPYNSADDIHAAADELNRDEKKEAAKRTDPAQEKPNDAGTSKIRTFFDIIRDDSNKVMLKRCMSRLKRSLAHFLPKTFRGEVEFGFDDPALTGEVLVWLTFFYPLFGEHISVMPFFDRNLFSGKLELKGRFSLLPVGWPLILIWLDKDFQKVYNQLKE